MKNFKRFKKYQFKILICCKKKKNLSKNSKKNKIFTDNKMSKIDSSYIPRIIKIINSILPTD